MKPPATALAILFAELNSALPGGANNVDQLAFSLTSSDWKIFEEFYSFLSLFKEATLLAC
ncbi:hypothetical protein HK096_005870, partial [Nowakowskiella sp. JEL0078]